MLEYVEKNARTMSLDYDIWGKVIEVNKLIGKARSIELSVINLILEQSYILRILIPYTESVKILPNIQIN